MEYAADLRPEETEIFFAEGLDRRANQSDGDSRHARSDYGDTRLA
jgi:hypothetical protein